MEICFNMCANEKVAFIARAYLSQSMQCMWGKLFILF